MKKITASLFLGTFLFSMLLAANVYAANEEKPQSQLTFFNQKKAALKYEVRKKSEKPESYTLSQIEDRLPEKTVELKLNDAKLILSEMNTTLWDFEYKSKKAKPDCAPFAALKVKENETIVCQGEKEKSAKMLGLMGRLNYLLKQK